MQADLDRSLLIYLIPIKYDLYELFIVSVLHCTEIIDDISNYFPISQHLPYIMKASLVPRVLQY